MYWILIEFKEKFGGLELSIDYANRSQKGAVFRRVFAVYTPIPLPSQSWSVSKWLHILRPTFLPTLLLLQQFPGRSNSIDSGSLFSAPRDRPYSEDKQPASVRYHFETTRYSQLRQAHSNLKTFTPQSWRKFNCSLQINLSQIVTQTNTDISQLSQYFIPLLPYYNKLILQI